MYFPLGGSRVDGWKKFRNILIIFLVSGFWHGANWTFIAWGALHALYYIPVLYMKKNRDNINTVAEHTILPTGREWIQMLFTFFLVCIAWIFFRAENMDVALGYLGNMFSQVHGDGNGIAFMRGIILLIPFIIVEWMHRRQHDLRLFDMLKVHPYARIALELVITILVIDSFCTLDPQQFIYFQF